jgi:hypothetical protein
MAHDLKSVAGQAAPAATPPPAFARAGRQAPPPPGNRAPRNSCGGASHTLSLLRGTPAETEGRAKLMAMDGVGGSWRNDIKMPRRLCPVCGVRGFVRAAGGDLADCADCEGSGVAR